MKTIPFDKKVWCDMTFDNDDLANKFVEALNSAGVSCTKMGIKCQYLTLIKCTYNITHF